jgi:hypothetical protein
MTVGGVHEFATAEQWRGIYLDLLRATITMIDSYQQALRATAIPLAIAIANDNEPHLARFRMLEQQMHQVLPLPGTMAPLPGTMALVPGVVHAPHEDHTLTATMTLDHVELADRRHMHN